MNLSPPTIPESKFLYSPWPPPAAQLREPAVTLAQAQADLDAHYSDPEVAVARIEETAALPKAHAAAHAPKAAIDNTATWQAELDRVYADPKVAQSAGTGVGLPRIKPGKYTFTYAETLRWLRSRRSRRRHRALVARQRRHRESPTRSRDEIRKERTDAARGPPPGAEPKRKGAGPTSCPPHIHQPSTPSPYAGSSPPAISPNWISLGVALQAVLSRLGPAPEGAPS